MSSPFLYQFCWSCLKANICCHGNFIIGEATDLLPALPTLAGPHNVVAHIAQDT